jgi:hypothetical protein
MIQSLKRNNDDIYISFLLGQEVQKLPLGNRRSLEYGTSLKGAFSPSFAKQRTGVA